MKCDYCHQPMNYIFYINDVHWIKVVGEEKFDENVGHVCAHCTLERLGGLDWHITWNEPTANIRQQQTGEDKAHARPTTTNYYS